MARLRKRYLRDLVIGNLERRMVFIGGPRQVGKTTLARQAGGLAGDYHYFNWDRREHRLAIRKEAIPERAGTFAFDEIHKYPRWKTLIKGIWDTRAAGQKIIVTGSSRLDIFRRGGDSLMGRYRLLRLHPFSLREVEGEYPIVEPGKKPPFLEFGEIGRHLSRLMKFGGFPEPFLLGDETEHRLWLKSRVERIFREDIRDTENLRAIADLELMASLIPPRVAAPLSMKSLSEDIEVSPHTIKRWLDLLCRNYYLFRVPPWHRRLERALKKESKYYLWDWSEVPGKGARFENLVASHLLKFCQLMEDAFGFSVDLSYVRDLEKREVDFLITWNREPWILVECALKPGHSLSGLKYFAGRLGVAESFLVTLSDEKEYRDRTTGIRIMPASKFLMALA